jgi:hypothetical protein
MSGTVIVIFLKSFTSVDLCGMIFIPSSKKTDPFVNIRNIYKWISALKNRHLVLP